MRVAHVGDYALEGAVGVSKVVAELTASLKKAGVEPEVWRLSESNVTVSENPQDDIELIELPVRSRAETALRGLPRATKEFIRDRRGSIDIVHLHSVFTPHNVLVATQAATPYVLSPHGGYSHEVLHGRNRWAKFVWMRLHERRYVLRSTAVHALSEREAMYLQSVFPGIRTAVIPNGINPLEPKTEAQGLSPRLLFLGRLAIDHKGLDLLLEGYALFAAQAGDEVPELVLVGPDFRGGRRVLEERASSLGIAEHVRFQGPAYGDEKAELLRGSYAFVHTSRWEGIPIALLEALGAGCPVIVTPETNIGEDVSDRGAGIVIEGTPAKICAGLEAMYGQSRSEYELMRNNAASLAREKFSWPRVADRMIELYRSISP